MDVVESFAYLGCQIHNSGSSEDEIRRRIAITRDCMRTLDKHIWRSNITLDTKLRLYNVYVLPVLLYGAETWTMTEALKNKLNALD